MLDSFPTARGLSLGEPESAFAVAGRADGVTLVSIASVMASSARACSGLRINGCEGRICSLA